MKNRRNRHRLKEIRKDYHIFLWLVIGIGLLLFVVGIIKFLFFQPEVAVNARYLQPNIDNGGVIFIAGAVLLACGIQIEEQGKSNKRYLGYRK